MKTKKEQTRKDLLISAEIEFAKKGYIRTILDDISVNAGYGKGTIYNYFKNKKEIFIIVATKLVTELLEDIKREIKGIRNHEERLRKALRLDLECFERNYDIFMTLIKEAHVIDKEAQGQLLNITYPLFEFYSNLIEEGKEEGCYSENVNPFVTATLIVGMCENISEMNKIMNGTLGSIEDLVEIVFNTVLFGIKNQ